MIDMLLRRPDGPSARIADGLRALGLLSVLAAFIGWGLVEVLLFLLVLLGQLLTRAAGTHPVLDGATSAVLLLASWSAVLAWYAAVPALDLAVHFAATGVLAALAFRLWLRWPEPAPQPAAGARAVLHVLSLGALLSVLWEFGEWFGYYLVSSEINVGYDDTVGDLAAGLLGSLAAGILLALRRPAADVAGGAGPHAGASGGSSGRPGGSYFPPADEG
ncbi:hypothetical protein [Arthrobacter mangrovi]|uniref:DUF2238 domain-containing protein n=1 Tax=Arthrobacter mangrovi TaxID=2966350 RepID=A0ABQ5MV15_9MICC|nr:hypothetical protein [Arthrobacter mangrovi]GLB67837.1 hypothetical protein AHIS1636_22770 [Arthrobacter mangrovi]